MFLPASQTPPPYINIAFYGGQPSASAATNTTAFVSAVTALGASGGSILFGAGTYSVNLLTLPANVYLVGQGPGATILQLANGANTDLIQTTNFASLTGTNATATPYNLGVMGMTLDGNKANNASGGNCLSIYAYGYTLRDVRLRNANVYGLWTEWGTASASPGNDSMEAFITDFKIHDCKQGGIYFKGPHDTQLSNGIIFNNGNGSGTNAITIPTDQYGSGSIFSLIHVWGGNYDYAVKNSCTGITFADCQLEGSLLAEYWLGANNCNILDCKIFSLEPLTVSNVVKGIVFANSAVNAFITAKMENIGGGVLDLTNSGGDHFIEIFADYYTPSINVPSPGYVGSLDANSTLILHFLNISGASTSDSTITFPGKIATAGFTAAGAYAGGVGINTGPSASNGLLIDPGANGNKGLTIFAHSGSQSAVLLDLQNGSFADVFTVDKAGNIASQGSAQLGGTSTLFAGSGAPGAGLGSNGDYYFRQDGGVNTHLYFKAAGAWSGLI